MRRLPVHCVDGRTRSVDSADGRPIKPNAGTCRSTPIGTGPGRSLFEEAFRSSASSLDGCGPCGATHSSVQIELGASHACPATRPHGIIGRSFRVSLLFSVVHRSERLDLCQALQSPSLNPPSCSSNPKITPCPSNYTHLHAASPFHDPTTPTPRMHRFVQRRAAAPVARTMYG